jgi:Cof subfamily protein (haloacid dehalogenase superfamily)
MNQPASSTPEPDFPIRLIALDIDGTIIGDDGIVGPRTRAAIRAARDLGIGVSLVTGRMVSSARFFAEDLGLADPIVGYQGGLIRAMPPAGSPRLGRLLSHTALPPDTARRIVTWTREQGLDPHLNHLERFILRADDPKADDYSRFMGARAELVPDLMAAIDHPITKVLAVGEPPMPVEFLRAAREAFAGSADVTISHPRFLEFVAPGVSKGRAVRYLARRSRVPLSAVLAIGDQWNDLEMLASVGHGAAMPSAPDAVRSVARYIAPPLADEGAGQMIEALALAAPDDARVASRRMASAATAAAGIAAIAAGADRRVVSP